MATRNLIQITQVCTSFGIDVSFVHSLHELGHVEVILENEDHFIDESQLKTLEQMIYFHSELQINLEGIDAIAHLLRKIENLQKELADTRKLLKEF
jgi:hypothetical protein